VPVEIVDLFITNTTESTKSVKHIDIDFADSFVPVGQKINITHNQHLTLQDDTSETYNIKVVSANGILETIRFPLPVGGTDSSLETKLIADPPQIANSGNVTVIMQVYNRGDQTLYDVQPTGTPSITPTSISVTAVTQTAPLSIEKLKPNEGAVFTWNYKLFGAVGNVAIISGAAKAKHCEDASAFAVTSNSASTASHIERSTEVSAVGPAEPFATPKIFVSIPNPFGYSSGANGHFAVTITNPTNQTLIINQVSIWINNPKGYLLSFTPFRISSNGTTIGVNSLTSSFKSKKAVVFSPGTAICLCFSSL